MVLYVLVLFIESFIVLIQLMRYNINSYMWNCFKSNEYR